MRRVSYRNELKGINERVDSTKGADEMWGEFKQELEVAMVKKKIKIRNVELGHRTWYDRQCSKKRYVVKNALRNWKKG